MTLQVEGVVSAAQLRGTAEHIAALQQPDGLIPWFAGHYADPWNHVEAAMALNTAGLRVAARAAYEWCARTQQADGSWPMQIVGTEITESSTDANQVAYVAAGVWHDWLLTSDRTFVDAMWPVVRAAIDWVLELQRPDGAISWSRDAAGVANPEALLIGSSSIVMSLRCALALAELVGDEHPEWELAAARLAHAVRAHPQHFGDLAEQGRYSMHWYYPVLGGAAVGASGRALIDAQWDEFVVPGRGVRCVSDRPWVTAAETCELALALDAVGDRARAGRLFADIQFLRADGGGYWTGWVWPEESVWPGEQSTWTSAAVLLAADALAEATPAHALFRGTGLPELLEVGCDEECLVDA